MSDDPARPGAWMPLPEIFRHIAAENRPAVLLETAKKDSEADKSFLFLHPLQELIAWKAEDLDALLRNIDRSLAGGAFVAGCFNYECGEHFVGLPSSHKKPASPEGPLAWLGVFQECIWFDHATGAIHGSLPKPSSDDTGAHETAEFTSVDLEISKDDYQSRIHSVQEHLKAGHSYQINFTDRIRGLVESSPLAIYRTLLRQQPVSFAAYLNTPAGTVLSFSPEMFFLLSGAHIKVRPMKGTWPRGLNTAGDRLAARQFQQDEKNRSEHVTIVDLLRNDLGRVCRPGSVVADKLFQVERYRTLFQMTSTISGTLAGGITPSEIFRSLFPSGSITGAPKRKTMEIIRDLESHSRGIYTGSIGYFSPDGMACFNVAIRTLVLKNGTFTLGVGGGITADSRAEDEYEECRLKGSFLTRRRPSFSLIETMRCHRGIPLLPFHLERLADSAAYFDIQYDADALNADITAAVNRCGETESRVRLTLDEAGRWAIATSPLETAPWSGRLLLSPERTNSKDVFLHHKTTNRTRYDDALAAARKSGFDEVLFMNEDNEITEGATTNIFLRKAGKWRTPDLRCGLLPGIQRAAQLRSLPNVQETRLHLDDLSQAEEIFLCNALRGIRCIQGIETMEGKTIWSRSGHSSTDDR